MSERIEHGFAPIYNCETRVLLLGTMPSPKSREVGFYYGHPQNRFWRVMAALFQEEPGLTPQERAAFLLAHHIGLWDVLASCDIEGAADSSIHNPVVNHFSPLFVSAHIQQVFTTGATAWKFYQALSHFAIGSMPDLWCLAFCVLSTLLWAQVAARFANRATPLVLNRATGVVLSVLGVIIITVNYL